MQWGPWGGVGMASDPGLQAKLERVGMGIIHPASGLAALASVLSQMGITGNLVLAQDLKTYDTVQKAFLEFRQSHARHILKSPIPTCLSVIEKGETSSRHEEATLP